MCSKKATPYRVDIRPSAKRDLKKLKNNRIVLESVDKTIRSLADNPRPFGVEHLEGNLYRVRDGEYRILYEIDDYGRRVDVKVVRDRKEAYKH